jgi:hypothetical protein
MGGERRDAALRRTHVATQSLACAQPTYAQRLPPTVRCDLAFALGAA